MTHPSTELDLDEFYGTDVADMVFATNDPDEFLRGLEEK